MSVIIRLLLVILIIFSTSSLTSQKVWAEVQGIDGNDLADLCRFNNKCDLFITGYVLGVIDGMPRTSSICYPDGGTANQFAAVIKKYIDNHPEERHLHATDIILESMQDAFPC